MARPSAKSAFNSNAEKPESTEPLYATPTVSRGVHVGADVDLGRLADINRSARTDKRLFVDMAVRQNASIEQFPFRAEDFPPVCVLITACIRAFDTHREHKRRRHLNRYDIRKGVGLGRRLFHGVVEFFGVGCAASRKAGSTQEEDKNK